MSHIRKSSCSNHLKLLRFIFSSLGLWLAVLICMSHLRSILYIAILLPLVACKLDMTEVAEDKEITPKDPWTSSKQQEATEDGESMSGDEWEATLYQQIENLCGKELGELTKQREELHRKLGEDFNLESLEKDEEELINETKRVAACIYGKGESRLALRNAIKIQERKELSENEQKICAASIETFRDDWETISFHIDDKESLKCEGMELEKDSAQLILTCSNIDRYKEGMKFEIHSIDNNVCVLAAGEEERDFIALPTALGEFRALFPSLGHRHDFMGMASLDKEGKELFGYLSFTE